MSRFSLLALMLLALLPGLYSAPVASAQQAEQEPDGEVPSELSAAIDQARAEGAWPHVDLDPDHSGDAHTIDRGPGFYLSIAKLVLVWGMILAWVKIADWINRDCQRHRLDFSMWNPAVVAPFFFAAMLMWTIPVFLVGFVLMLLALAAPAGVYVYVRNEKVDPSERVLTPDHLRHLLSSKAKGVGLKIDAEKKAAHQRGAPVELKATAGANSVENNALLLKARQLPGFVVTKDLLANAMTARSDLVMLDYTSDGVAIRYQIDGVLHAVSPADRETGDAALAAVKTLSGLNPGERVKKQVGQFEATFSGTTSTCRLITQGTPSGERVLLRFEMGGLRFHSLSELGMRDKPREQLMQLLEAKSGLVLFSSLPGGGLTALLQAAVEESDRLMRNFAVIEAQGRPQLGVDNVEAFTYDPSAGEGPTTTMRKVHTSQPEVLIIPELTDTETALAACETAGERLVIAGIRAKSAPEALLRVMMLKVPGAQLAAVATGVVHVRLVRLLNADCRVAYQPAPELLGKLGLPADRVQVLYREPTAEELAASGYRIDGRVVAGFEGRTGMFEVLVVSDPIRQVLAKQPKLELVKKGARQAGMRSHQEEGILLAVQGATSLNEVMRVLKQ